MIEETWQELLEYAGLYEVSSLGRIRSLGRITSDGRTLKPKILKLTQDKEGYCTVSLYSSDSKVKCYKQHRLVAEVFIPNPENKPHVNHINGIKTDNSSSNLEWVTAKENNAHQLDTSLKKQNKVGVYKEGKLVAILSGKQQQILFGLDPSSVSKCIHGKRGTHKGFTFKLEQEDIND